MQWSFIFFMNSGLLGIGLAMDAFSVSLANGLNEPGMGAGRMNLIAGVYSFLQFAMPMIGWICVHTIVERFSFFERFIPWIALALLLYIGGEMLIDGIRHRSCRIDGTCKEKRLGFGKLAVQGLATSIDALSVGFTIESYPLSMALSASLIIAGLTHATCLSGLVIGKRFGTKLADKSAVLGGCILIIIGIEIFVKGVFF